MARSQAISLSPAAFYPSIFSSLRPPTRKTRTKSNGATITNDKEIKRPTSNYPPSCWDYNYVKLLTSEYSEEKYGREIDELKEYVKNLINGNMHGSLEKLELIDSVQRLGLNYHYKEEIKKALEAISSDDAWFNSDLHSTALRFRLFREHGYIVPQVTDVFKRFKDETGKFNPGLCDDVKGLLSLYEASFFSIRGEDILDEAKTFTSTNLLKSLNGEISASMQRKVKQALDIPLQQTLPRLETQRFIRTYEQEENMDPKLLRLAKLDYNKVQSIYQKEVRELAKWWMELGLYKFNFLRDRLVEHYLWGQGLVWEPQYGDYRFLATKIICILTAFDDCYDAYGSIEELELFTDFIDRWDITEIDILPPPMRMILLAAFNTTNEVAYWKLKEFGFNILPYLRKQWSYICSSYMKEAKILHQGYKQTFGEYIDLAVVSSGAPIMVFCSYALNTDKITVEALDSIEQLPSIMMCPCMIGRLVNDVVTSPAEMERGDNINVLVCYMNDTGATIEEAKEYMNSLLNEQWKIQNEDVLKTYPYFSEPFITSNLNFSRTIHFVYHYEDGHGIAPQNATKDHLVKLLVKPISLH